MNEDLRETLVILGEECNEVAKEIFKILRYGPDQIKPGTEKTNIQQFFHKDLKKSIIKTSESINMDFLQKTK